MINGNPVGLLRDFISRAVFSQVYNIDGSWPYLYVVNTLVIIALVVTVWFFFKCIFWIFDFLGG